MSCWYYGLSYTLEFRHCNMTQWAAMRTYENLRFRWIVHQTKILALRRNNIRFFTLLYKQNINPNTFKMYYHHTKFSDFVLFYIIKWTLISYNFNDDGSSDMPVLPFESPECPLFDDIFKVWEDQSPSKLF